MQFARRWVVRNSLHFIEGIKLKFTLHGTYTTTETQKFVILFPDSFPSLLRDQPCAQFSPSDPVPASQGRDSDHLLSRETWEQSIRHLVPPHQRQLGSMAASKPMGNGAECKAPCNVNPAAWCLADRGWPLSLSRRAGCPAVSMEPPEKHDPQHLAQTCTRTERQRVVSNRGLRARMRKSQLGNACGGNLNKRGT